jgi:opacity protein-like surface antigen
LFQRRLPALNGDVMFLRHRLLVARIGLAVLVVVAGANDLRAQSYISPFVGYDFGGDSVCAWLTDCEKKQLNVGVAIGRLGSVFGYETEFGYTRDFYGTAPGVTSSLLTAMGNVMFVPAVGPVRPYALAGLGLIRSQVDVSSGSTLISENGNSDLGWDVGGGVFVSFGDRIGLRGDIRYFHSFKEFTVAGLRLGDADVDFGRGSAALVIKF